MKNACLVENTTNTWMKIFLVATLNTFQNNKSLIMLYVKCENRLIIAFIVYSGGIIAVEMCTSDIIAILMYSMLVWDVTSHHL